MVATVDHAEADQPERHRLLDRTTCPIAGLAHTYDVMGFGEGLLDPSP
jgi:hypothetical protein